MKLTKRSTVDMSSLIDGDETAIYKDLYFTILENKIYLTFYRGCLISIYINNYGYKMREGRERIKYLLRIEKDYSRISEIL